MIDANQANYINFPYSKEFQEHLWEETKNAAFNNNNKAELDIQDRGECILVLYNWQE